MKVWTKDDIHALLDKSPAAVMRAITAIYQRQTDDERSGAYTRETNGVGFSKFDAEFMTSLAIQIANGRGLSPKQMAVGRNKIKRYWRQLVEIANGDAIRDARALQPVADRVSEQAIEPEAGKVEVLAAPVGEGTLPADCTCAEHEWYDGEDVCPACHRAGRGALLGLPRTAPHRFGAGDW